MHTGHRERMKKKYILDGIDKFHEHEILEMILYYAIPRKNTNEIAHCLIKRFGNLASVFDAPFSLLKETAGVGESAAILIKLIPDLTRAYMDCKTEKCKESLTIKEACDKLALQFLGRNEEVVGIMLLDAKNKPIYCGIINKGTVNSVDLYARKIIELVVMYNASAGIIGHNHPSGLAIPSREDLTSTRKLQLIFQNMGIKLIDHIIVADGDYVSLISSNPESLEKIWNYVEKRKEIR